jgi:hypothetical protein
MTYPMHREENVLHYVFDPIGDVMMATGNATDEWQYLAQEQGVGRRIAVLGSCHEAAPSIAMSCPAIDINHGV